MLTLVVVAPSTGINLADSLFKSVSNFTTPVVCPLFMYHQTLKAIFLGKMA